MSIGVYTVYVCMCVYACAYRYIYTYAYSVAHIPHFKLVKKLLVTARCNCNR